MWPGLAGRITVKLGAVGRITVKLGARAVAGHLQLASRHQHTDISMVTIPSSDRNSASLFLISWCRISLEHYLLSSSLPDNSPGSLRKM